MKRLLAVLLTLSMMVSVVPFSAFADSPGTTIVPDISATVQEDTATPALDENTVQAINSDPLLHGQYAPEQPQQTQPTVDASDVTMEATDGFGKLLLNSINEQNDISDGDERVIDVTVDISGKTATVKYVSSQDADLVVALYSDGTEEEMVASGTTDAPAMLENTGSAETTVSLTGTIPNSFKVKAFLLDKAEHAPLCNEYSSSAYTKDIQDIENATVNDYPEDRVINLDDDNSTNFAVVNGNAVLVDASDASAGGMSITDNGGSYTISNADERTRNLQPGEIFVYQEGNAVLVLRVDAISLDGNDVTITGGNDDIDLTDVFDVVKIESIDDGEPMEYSPVGADASVQYCGIVDSSSPLDETNSLSLDASPTFKTAIKFIIGSDTFYDGEKTDISETEHVTSKAGLNAVVNLKLTTTFKLHLAFDNVSFSFSTDSEIFGGVEVSYSESYAIDLGELKKELPGVYLDYTPQFVLNGEVKGTFKYTITSKEGFAYENKEFHDISEQPVINLSINVSGTFYVGVKFAPSLKVGVHNPFKAPTKENFLALVTFTLSLDIGEEVKLESTIPTDPVAANQITSAYHGTSVHECISCLSGTLQFKVKITVKADSLKVLEGSFTPVDYAPSPHPFYFSADYVDANFGTCPHQLYLVNISIDSAYSPVGAEVFATDENNNTYSLGNMVGSTNNYCYMRPGKYSLRTTVNGDNFIGSITVDSNSVDVTLQYNTATATSGLCGDNLTWNLDSDGTLVISGTGDMFDYGHNKSPWSNRIDIKKAIIKDGVTSIGDYAFYACYYLTDIQIPDSVVSIGQLAFSGCPHLGDITIPDSVTSLGYSAFYISGLTSIALSNNLTRIEDQTFGGCNHLTTVTIPESVTSIGSFVFSQCEKLETVEIPNSVTSIGQFTFLLCPSLTHITIPDSMTALDNGLFVSCTALNNITIPDSVTSIGSGVFGNSGIFDITLSHGITCISYSSFTACPNLTSITIPAGVTEIGIDAFNSCSNLTSVTIPDSVTKIGVDAFYGCTSLKTVNYSGSPEQWESIDIWGDNNSNSALLNANINFYYVSPATVSSEENSISYTTPDSTGDARSYAASFTDLTPGVSYSVIVSKSSSDPLAPENLIYINQFRASSEGYQQSFRTRRNSSITDSDMAYVAAAGSYSFDSTPVTPGGDSGGSSSGGSSGGGGGGGGGAAVVLGIGAAAAITAGVILTMPVDVQGHVELADHAVVPGAKISLLQKGNVVTQTTADESGNFTLKAKRGDYELTVVYTDANGQFVQKTSSIKAPAKDLVITF